MQPALHVAARSGAARALTPLALQIGPSDAQKQATEWLSQLEREAQESAQNHSVEVIPTARQDEGKSAAPVQARGERYNFYIGGNLSMFSTAKREQHLRNMHEPNHRELRIAKIAARVADFLWPRCQENIDEAIAKHKVMAAKSRVHVPESEYQPPSVPHFLPFTNWVRNSKELRESFVCDSTKVYKPRMAWYNPNDGMVPSNWLTEGLLADLAYYKPFTGLRKASQSW